jgi:hypothetical protein
VFADDAARAVEAFAAELHSSAFDVRRLGIQ